MNCVLIRIIVCFTIEKHEYAESMSHTHTHLSHIREFDYPVQWLHAHAWKLGQCGRRCMHTVGCTLPRNACVRTHARTHPIGFMRIPSPNTCGTSNSAYTRAAHKTLRVAQHRGKSTDPLIEVATCDTMPETQPFEHRPHAQCMFNMLRY